MDAGRTLEGGPLALASGPSALSRTDEEGCGSPAAVAVYKGTSLTGLTRVASDHTTDYCMGGPAAHFVAFAGTTYNIAV